MAGKEAATCGTYAAARAHERRSEPLCPPCLDARRIYWREKSARQYAQDSSRKQAAVRRWRERVYGRFSPDPQPCRTCSVDFLPTVPNKVYCSPACSPHVPKTRKVVASGVTPRRTGRPWRTLRDLVFAEEPDCGICGGALDASLAWPHPLSRSVDHVVPIALGGELLARENVRAAHLVCNLRRGARSYDAQLRRLSNAA